MSGHSHWAGIKHKKEITDKKRGKIFSKLLKAITAAVQSEPNPDFNPRLRTTVQKAKEAKVPVDNIERAIKKASEPDGGLENLTIESYGPGGAAILIEATADNKNRAIAEIKKILSDHGAKLAEQGSVRWAFEQVPSTELGAGADSLASPAGRRELNPSTQLGTSAGQRGQWTAKFAQEINKEDAGKLNDLIEALEEHDDVQEVYTNAKS